MTENSTGQLTIVTAQMTDTEIDRAIDEVKREDKELLITDENDQLFHFLRYTQRRGS